MTQYNTSGLYLGVMGFNNALYPYQYNSSNFRLLTSSSKSSFQSHISGLKTAIGTALYYAVDKAVSNLENSRFPADLSKVAIVTFTDGLDRGSVEYGDEYESVSAVSQHLKSARVDGKAIDAYAIGLKGNDATNVSRFKENLTALSSSASNAMEVADMDEVNAKFQEIANSLYKETKTLSISIVSPGLTNGQKFRFTFDGNLDEATSSTCYIEGVWDRKNNVLSSVSYQGLKCSNGSSVSLTKEESIFYSFTLKDVVLSNDKVFEKSKIQMWLQEGGVWGKNSEFNPNSSSDPVVEQKSAVIMLVLDCSSSLDDEKQSFKQVQTAANNFISTLYSSVGSSSSSEGSTSTIYVSENGSRMPTDDEFRELRDDCTWEWTTQNGVKGYKVTGPNGNSIFLPAAGYRGCNGFVYYEGKEGKYWSSSSGYPGADYLGFYSDVAYMSSNYRYNGLSVRLVKDL
ncbi:MAG: VWA domain-containing protein [Paludibacteraceae bacterium]|nr:VWA domain-containing protein [Paludibacteraceae bacterium]